jgi:EF hand
MKMSQTDCDAAWLKLDGANTGSVSQAQVKALIPDFKAADANGDGKLSQMEFRQACDKGLVNSTASMGAGAGAGANSRATRPDPNPPLPK